jgi:predicted enzyme related to lactoylglutathione lyase
MPNPFVHVELNTTDLDNAKAFYGKLFAWEKPIGKNRKNRSGKTDQPEPSPPSS